MPLPPILQYDPAAPQQRDEDAWALNAAQHAFVCCTERFSFYVGGIGAGKTYAGAVRAIRHSDQHPGSLGLVGAPTYPMLRDVPHRR